MAHSSESLALDQVEDRYIMQKIQRITIGILNELSFWLKYGVLLLQGVPWELHTQPWWSDLGQGTLI